MAGVLAAVLGASVALAAGGMGTADGVAPAAASDLGSLPTVSRIAGADRFEMAVLVAQRLAPTGAETVYLASGTTFADALSAGPAAAHSWAPILLVTKDLVPAVVTTELLRLNPHRVVVVGGTAAVSDAVVGQVSASLPGVHVDRIGGADRYEVSRNVVADAFSVSGTALVATGTNFPDALSAGAVAGGTGAPVLLVYGAATAADAPTIAAIARLRSVALGIAGGSASLSDGVMSTLAPPAVPRLRFGGADRYAVSLALNEGLATNWSMAYLATGANYPDALAGGVLAGVWKTPLFVVPPDCVPLGVLAAIRAHGTAEVRLLGGTASLSSAVEALTPCGW